MSGTVKARPLQVWFWRALLLLLISSMAYVTTRPLYNYAHWIPHQFLRKMGVSYEVVYWGETNGDLLLHFFGGLILTWLIYLARLPGLGRSALLAFLSVSALCIGAEIFQYLINRGVESSDLLLGILGSFMAYLALNKNK